MEPKIETAESFPVSIFIAGNYSHAVRIAQNYCDRIGFCVTVTPTRYVYTGNNEEGVIVGLINYPRFPADQETIMNHAIELGNRLLEGLDQQSFSIQNPVKTVWYNYRRGDLNDSS